MIKQYLLNKKHDISTAKYLHKRFDVFYLVSDIACIAVDHTKTKLIVLDNSSLLAYSFTLKIPGDITTAIYDNKFFNMAPFVIHPIQMKFTEKNMDLLVLDMCANHWVRISFDKPKNKIEYNLMKAFLPFGDDYIKPVNISIGFYNGMSYNIPSVILDQFGSCVSPDGLFFYEVLG